jgi:hypothetical protein
MAPRVTVDLDVAVGSARWPEAEARLAGAGGRGDGDLATTHGITVERSAHKGARVWSADHGRVAGSARIRT